MEAELEGEIFFGIFLASAILGAVVALVFAYDLPKRIMAKSEKPFLVGITACLSAAVAGVLLYPVVQVVGRVSAEYRPSAFIPVELTFCLPVWTGLWRGRRLRRIVDQYLGYLAEQNVGSRRIGVGGLFGLLASNSNSPVGGMVEADPRVLSVLGPVAGRDDEDDVVRWTAAHALLLVGVIARSDTDGRAIL
jgi:hypothetical protein